MSVISLRVFCLVAAVVSSFGPARADDFTDRINRAYANIPQDRRAENVLIPALGQLEEPPAVLIGRADRVLLLTPSSPIWASASAWAQAQPQQDMLEAIFKVTQENNPRRAMVFALPYGIRGIPTDWVRKGLHAELGDPPTIAGAKLGYLDRLAWVETLVHIEATRLLYENKPEQAMELMFHTALLGRMLADRSLHREVVWGMDTMRTAMLRLRDIAYVDSKNDHALTSDFLTEMVKKIDVRRGMFRLDRIRMPLGDQIAAEQMIERVFARTGEPDSAVFPTAMAELAATDRPLRLFAESGKWQKLESGHATKQETADELSAIFNDWSLRWDADLFDPTFRTPTEYEKLSTRSFGLIAEIVPDIGGLLVLRRELETEIIGTRLALAIEALVIESGGSLPSDLYLIRPRYIDELGIDPYNPNRAANNKPPYKYFVPERDTVGGRLHTMNVIPRNRPNFSVTLGREDFVLYSLGGNEF
ncbi:MAG TPA: hypothetical protein ENJ00_04560, partial [Phycisphaerales bacterium]|nr:hypothetical protein [Phycisphaerales bacterium]